MSYTTVLGDTWDVIAKRVYGKESYIGFLMANNFDYLDILIFSPGITLNAPSKPEEMEIDLPPWRR